MKLHLYFFFASKSWHHLSLSWSCANTCICLLKQYLYLHMLWSRTIICLCNEVALALFFCHKVASTLYLLWSHANIHLCHEATSTLYLHWSHANIRLCHDIMSTLHLHCSRTNIGLYNEAALAPIFRGNIAQTSRVHSTLARHQDFRDANKTLMMPEKWRQYFEDDKVCQQEFDIARTCP